MRHLLPTYERHQYKGQGGKVAVIGGSKTYTGAPYFAAIASLRTGADLAFVYCHEEAAIPIKSYSPEIIVNSIFSKMPKEPQVKPALEIAKSIVMGPGLGRQPFAEEVFQATLGEMTRLLEERETPRKISLILDADALWQVMNHYEVILPKFKQMSRRQDIILTPNLIEFKRIWQA